MMNWWGFMNAIFYHPAWTFVIMAQEVFLVLLIFKVFSGDWLGRKEKKQ